MNFPLSGLSGLFPIHPKTFIRAKDNREALAKRHAEMLKAAALDSEKRSDDASEAKETSAAQ